MTIAELSYEHQQVVEAMKSQLLIVLVNRLGGAVDVPVAEIDGTGRYNLAMRVDRDTRVFSFVVQEKNRT